MDMRTDNWSGTATRPVGLIIRQKGPNNLEMPFDQLGDFITPSELFYIRSHFPCACRKLNPAISVMESAQYWATKNVPDAIDGARDRCIFL